MMSKRYRHIRAFIVLFVVLSALLGCGSGITMKAYHTPEEQFSKSMEEYQKKHFVKAIDGFQKVVYNFSGSDKVDSAQYFLAMAYYRDKEYYLAASEFERLVNNYPGSPFVDDAQYMSGLCYFKSSPKHYGLDQEELIKAIEVLQDFVTDYPESEFADDARATIKLGQERLARKRFESGKMYFRLAYYKSAKIYFQRIIDEYTNSEYAARSLYYMGEIEYKQKHYQEAKTKFQNFLVVYPEHKLVKKAKKRIAEIDKRLAEPKTN